MIKLNGKIINIDRFGDKTLKIEEPLIGWHKEIFDITWAYDGDDEIFTLYALNEFIREYCGPKAIVTLDMPYIPNARQDRRVSDRLFTLKYFTKLINSMNFDKVFVTDPHSDVAVALINKVSIYREPVEYFIPNEINYQIMYPDAGAAKKYGCSSAIIGNKIRNKNGRIESYQLLNFPEKVPELVVIRDDICSYGGTFVEAAKALRAKGVQKIWLVVSHCEDNILKGEVFDYIDKVITTDSICHVTHEKLDIRRLYRNV